MPNCLHCHTRRASTSRLLCQTCYARPSIRHQYPVATKCRHCKERRPLQSRGLCSTCYADPVIRADYPVKDAKLKGHYSSKPQRVELTETDADLDRLIASRRATMPKRRMGEE